MAPDDMNSDLVEPVVKHVDLWNRNVEFIEDEDAWPRPAVFIEFEAVKWTTVVPGVQYSAEPRILPQSMRQTERFPCLIFLNTYMMPWQD